MITITQCPGASGTTLMGRVGFICLKAGMPLILTSSSTVSLMIIPTISHSSNRDFIIRISAIGRATIVPLIENTDFIYRIQRVSSYIMNGAVCGFGTYGKPKFKIFEFNPAAYVHWEPKVNNEGGIKGPFAYNTGHDASQIPNDREGIGNRHGKGAGIIGFDTRVHWISLLKFNQEAASHPGLLWCVPNSKTGGF